MNSSQQLQGTTPAECTVIIFTAGDVPRHFSTLPYSIFVINIVILVITCPFTIVLNALVAIAVKMKARLQSIPNIALACLAASDTMVGICVQPLYISLLISILQGRKFSNAPCPLQKAAIYSVNFFCISSVAHLVLMTADRYMAIKHTYTYDAIITKTRVFIASAIGWIVTAMVHSLILIDQNIFIAINNAFLVAFLLFVIFCNVMIYRETRRHERQIAEEQVSVEARENFLKEKRALKITTTIVAIVTFSYLPLISVRIINNTVKDRILTNAMYPVYFSAPSLVLVNSLLNPIIYSIRLRQFRVAFIELLLKKNYAQAEQFEQKIFGSVIHQVNAPNGDLGTHQGGEKEEQTANQVNVANSDLGTNQGGEREEQDVNQVKAANSDLGTYQGGEREKQDASQVDVANCDLGTNQGGETEEQDANQVNAANSDLGTHQGGEREEQDANQVNVANSDLDTN